MVTNWYNNRQPLMLNGSLGSFNCHRATVAALFGFIAYLATLIRVKVAALINVKVAALVNGKVVALTIVKIVGLCCTDLR